MKKLSIANPIHILMTQHGIMASEAIKMLSKISIGKGRNVTIKSRHGKHMDTVRAARKTHNINKRKK